MKLAIIPLSGAGKLLGNRLVAGLREATLLEVSDGMVVKDLLHRNWSNFDGFICIMATGIVVRAIAPLLRDKYRDPCVVVLDNQGRYAISLLGGHLGGGNELARHLAAMTGGSAVITTASDSQRLTAVDLWLTGQNIRPGSRDELTRLAAQLVDHGELKIYTELPVQSLPTGIIHTPRRDDCDCIISPHRAIAGQRAVQLYPRTTVIGVGCNRNTPEQEFHDALHELLEELGLHPHSIRNLATIDVKNDERGLLAFARHNGWPLVYFRREQLNSLDNIEISAAAMQAVGAKGVAEPAALLSAGNNILLRKKKKWKNITMAVAQAPFTLSAQVRAPLNI